MYSARRNIIGTYACLLTFIAGCWGNPFDPLPTRVRNIISSNHLSDETSQYFAEYHALLPNFRGDFGVKSDIIKESSKEPVYTGSDTVVVPLYIPHGAIPIQIHERIPRSGKSRSGSHFRILGGPSASVPGDSARINRPLLRRIGTASRRIASGPRKIPTPPPDFIRPWMKRRTAELASKASDNVEAAKRSKIMSHVADFRRRITKNTTTETPAKNTTVNAAQSTTPVSVISESIFLKNSSITTVSTTPSSTTRTTTSRTKPKLSSSQIVTTTTETPSTTGRSNGRNPTRSKIRRVQRPRLANRTNHERNITQSKRTSLQDDISTTTAAPITTSPTSSSSILVGSTTTEISRGTGSFRIPIWPRRRQPVVPKSSQTTTVSVVSKETEIDKNNNGDIIDRVLNSAASHSTSVSTSTTPSSITLNSNENTSHETIKKIVETSTTPKDYSKDEAKTTTPVSVSSPSDIRVKGLPIAALRPLRNSKEENQSEENKSNYFKQNVNDYSTNSITTSTPKLPRPTPRRPLPRRRVPPTRHGQVVKTFHIPRRRTPVSPVNKVPLLPSATPKMKTAQDIVLEKLSKLMTVSAQSGKQSLEVIAREIEIINEELSALGIHIIDAEFDGHKLTLDPSGENTGITFAPSPTTATLEQFSVSLTPRPTVINHTTSNQNSEAVQKFLDSLVIEGEGKVKLPTQISSPKPIDPTVLVPHQSDLTEYTPDKWLGSSVLVHSSVNKDKRPITIRPATVEPSSSTSRTRSSVVPVTLGSDELKASINIDEALNRNSQEDSNQKVNPSSHFRPILRNLEADQEVIRSTTEESSTPRVSSPSSSSTSSTQPPDLEPQVKSVSLSPHQRTDDSIQNNIPEPQNETVFMIEINEASSQPALIENQTSPYIYFACILGVIPFVVLALLFWKNRYKSPRKALPAREERAEVSSPPIHHVRSSKHAGTLDALPAYVLENSESRASLWELPRSKLRFTGVIGEGNFGMVWKAEARNICDWQKGGGPTVLVAVKGNKENATSKEKSDLLRELSIMKILEQHSNIVTLLGCCTKHEPYYLVMEYVMFGKLLTFLRESRSKNNYFNFSSDTEHLTSKDLTRFAHQIATGCEYLQVKGIIHRDLAARNILVDHNKICKIADFGLARSVKDLDTDIYEQKSRGPLPIRWMALESLYMNIFTHKSDVWSFGILCWEIVTLGSTPYPGISAREVMRRVQEGYRLERPEHCRSEFYRIIASCWNEDFNKRPTFHELKIELRQLLDQREGWIDLENFQESTYYSMHENNEEKL